MPSLPLGYQAEMGPLRLRYRMRKFRIKIDDNRLDGGNCSLNFGELDEVPRQNRNSVLLQCYRHFVTLLLQLNEGQSVVFK